MTHFPERQQFFLLRDMLKNVSWKACGCTETQSCVARFKALLLSCEQHKDGEEEEERLKLFHAAFLRNAETEDICRDLPATFDVQQVVEIQNEFLYAQYAARVAATLLLRGEENEVTGYHVTNGPLVQICERGLDSRMARRGLFGTGIYAAADAVKANDYCADKGSVSAVRVMVRCQFVLGKTKAYGVGEFDRDLIVEPDGYDSVTGFIRRGTEYVVYTSDRVCVTHVIFYKLREAGILEEMSPGLSVPARLVGTGQEIVYITLALSEFFSKLQERAGAEGTQRRTAVRLQIRALLKKETDVAEFLAGVGGLLGARPPEDLEARMRGELAKSRLECK